MYPRKRVWYPLKNSVRIPCCGLEQGPLFQPGFAKMRFCGKGDLGRRNAYCRYCCIQQLFRSTSLWCWWASLRFWLQDFTQSFWPKLKLAVSLGILILINFSRNSSPMVKSQWFAWIGLDGSHSTPHLELHNAECVDCAETRCVYMEGHPHRLLEAQFHRSRPSRLFPHDPVLPSKL